MPPAAGDARYDSRFKCNNLSSSQKFKRQSASAAAAEEAALRARIAVVHRLHDGILEPSSVIAQTIAAYQDILDDVILDLVLDVHRAVKTGQDDLSDINLELPSAGVFPTASSGANPWRGRNDVFGQTISATASVIISCTNCQKRMAASRFAPHLEKCMNVGERSGGSGGGGKRPSRAARDRSPIIID